jgi:chitodextrinase
MTSIMTGLRLACCATTFTLLAGTAFAAPPDRKPPTTPTNLRVTAVGPYSVSLAWNPSTDNSGSFRYVICCANVNSQSVPGPASTAVYTAGLEPQRTWTLRIQAVDAAGNWSKPSNSVTFTTTADTIPPTQPVVSVTDVGPRHVSLLWSATDNGPHVWYVVRVNGAPLPLTRNTSQIFPLLQPQTDYVFTVQARDFSNHVSPPSEPVEATTEAPNPNDVTAPTNPILSGGPVDTCEVQLQWTESTDDLDPQFVIEYEVYVNGVRDHSTALRITRTIVYANRNGLNTFAVAAVDTAGNRSALSEIDGTFQGCEF